MLSSATARLTGLLIAAIALTLSIAPAGASAAPAFLDPQDLETLTGPVFPSGPSSDFNASGEALVAVLDDVGGGGAHSIRVDLRAPGGAIDRQVLPDGGSVDIVPSFDPAVDLARGGAGVVAWAEDNSIQYALRAPGGSFGPVDDVKVPAADTTGMREVSAAIDDAGNVTFAWTTVTGSFPNQVRKIRTVQRRASDGNFTSSELIEQTDSGHSIHSPQVDVNAAGRAVLSYFVLAVGPGAASYAFRDTAIGTFGSRYDLSNLNAAVGQVIAENGDAVVGYEQSMDVKLRIRPGDGPLGAPITVDAGAAETSTPQVGIDREGTPTIAWTRNDAGTRKLQTCSAGPLGCLAGTRATIASSNGGIFPDELAVAPSGAALLAWHGAGPDSTVAASARPAGGSFGPAKTLGSAGSDYPEAGIDDAGNGIVSWRQDDAGGRRVRIAGYDPNPPKIDSFAVPATGSIGEQLQFSAGASDVWGPVSLAWDFGDGGSAQGAGADHAYASAGQNTATVTATDAAGNAATASGTTAIADSSAADATAPVYTSAPALTNPRFRVGGKKTPVTTTAAAKRRKKAPAGTTFTYALDEAATVAIRVERRDGGRRKGKRCVKATRKNRAAKACVLRVPAGELSRSSVAGSTKVAFTGRIGSKALKPGRYTATFIATDSSGNAAKPATVSFSIVKR